MKRSSVVKRKHARPSRLGRLWRRSGPLLVAIALLSGSFNRTSRARDGGSIPGGFSPAGVVRSPEGAGREGSLSLHLPELRMPELYRTRKGIGPSRAVGVAERLASKEAATVGRLSDAVSGRLVERGDRRITLGEGRDVTAVFNGPRELAWALEQDEAVPLSMASGDLDGDGVADLACGFSIAGGGALTLYRGNQDIIYGPVSRGTGLESPFLPSVTVLKTPDKPDFIAIGDFDADGYQDLVVATLGLNKLVFLRGTETGDFRPPEEVTLPGAVTAVTTGDVNRRDGLPDIAVAVAGQNGSRLLIFEGPGGAMSATPEVLDLPAAASAVALGQLDEDYPVDLAVAAGRQLIVIHGRDRKLSLDLASQAGVKPAVTDHYALGCEAKSLAIGDFTGKQRDQIALVADDGSTHVWDRGKAAGHNRWTEVTNRLTSLSGSSATGILSVRASAAPCDNLVLLDSSGNRMGVFALDRHSAGPAAFEAEGGPVAAIPMRLNSDGMQDLVILRRGHAAPMALRTEAGKISVGNTADGGPGSLRQAILDANASGQSAAIVFNVSGTGAPVIAPSSPLPTATVPVTIDGTTQPGAGFVVLDGGSAGAGANGFVLAGGNSLIKGLVIGHFSAAFDSQGGLTGGFGAFLTGGGSYTIEGCNIGVDSTGEAAQTNGLGIAITSNNNTIGGTAQGTGNVISGNTVDGIVVGTRSNNLIEGNFIGTDGRGVSALPNGRPPTGGDGMFLNDSINTTISGNLISGNMSNGVDVGGTGNLVKGNFIGTDANGLQAIGNGEGGVMVFSANNTVGGPNAGNLISGNHVLGLTIGLQGTSGISGNLVQGNFIGTNKSGNSPLGNLFGGVLVEASNNTVGGSAAGTGNLISASISASISGSPSSSANLDIEGDGTFGGNQVLGNLIGTDVTGTTALGSTVFGVFINQSANNTVGGPQPSTGNLISGHTADGLVLYQSASTGNLVQGNFIGTDTTGKLAVPNKGFGVGVTFAPGNTLTGNLISGNGVGGVGIGNVIKGLFGDSSTLLKGNFIGVDATLAAPLANNGNGVFVENDSINNQVVGNLIAFNQGAGIRIPDNPSDPTIPKDPAIQIKLSGNQVYANRDLGIDLGPPGPTPNPGNVLTGANRLQNFPEVRTAAVSGAAGMLAPAAATITVAGTMSASANTTYGLEFFLGGSCDSGQGHQFIGTIPALLGSGNVSTDGSGNASYTFTFPVPASSTVSNGFVNATATDPVGNTSEFSLCAPVTGTIPAGPVISSVQGAGKNLLITGQNFDSGAVILKNGERQRTLHDDQNPTTTLIGKKVNKNIAPGETVTIQVQNSDGSLSNQVTYTR